MTDPDTPSIAEVARERQATRLAKIAVALSAAVLVLGVVIMAAGEHAYRHADSMDRTIATLFLMEWVFMAHAVVVPIALLLAIRSVWLKPTRFGWSALLANVIFAIVLVVTAIRIVTAR